MADPDDPFDAYSIVDNPQDPDDTATAECQPPGERPPVDVFDGEATRW